MSTAPPSASPRMTLAELARTVVESTPGVALTAAGRPAWQTAQGDRRIEGLTSVVAPDGRYELGLHLVVEWPVDPLPQLAADLRRRVRADAARAGVAELLGSVNIDVVSVCASPEQTA